MAIPVTLDDIEALARTRWGEARGEGVVGMEAVACVVLNRVRDPRWPNTAAAVCVQRRQFSCWNDRDPNLAKLQKAAFGDETFLRAFAIAAMALAGMVEDRTSGANHYLTADLFEGPSRPLWADGDKVTATIGRHVFLRL